MHASAPVGAPGWSEHEFRGSAAEVDPADDGRGAAHPIEKRDRIRSIDGLRSLALVLVFGFHTWEFAGHPRIPVITDILSQNTRPDFFVVLTGFVLFLPFARNPHRIDALSPARYLRRRLRRIVLPYYAALVLAVLLPQVLVILVRIIGGEASWQDWPSAGDWVTHLTFTHLFFPEHWGSINGSLWTMSLEMQIYLLFPLLLVLYARFGYRALVGAFLVSVAYRLVGGGLVSGQGFPNEFLVGASVLGRMAQVLAGILAAQLMVRWRGKVKHRGALLLLAIVVSSYLLAVSPLAEASGLGLREAALALAFGSLVLLAVTYRPAESIAAAGPASWLGFRAYSIFLVHQPVAWYVSEFLTKALGVGDGVGKLLLLWTVGSAAVLAIGLVLFWLVEKPCMEWAKRMPVTRPEPGKNTSGE